MNKDQRKVISIGDKILIAGATGMAGSAINKIFRNAGYGDRKNGLILTPTRNELNFLDFNSVFQWFKENKPTVVIIAAAKVGGIYANANMPADFILENLKIQTNLIENSSIFGVKRLLFLGSSCIYPKFAQQPIVEEELLTGSLESTNEWYAIAKIAGIKLCEAMRIQNGLDAICLMPTNLYGPGDNYHPLNSHVFASLIRKFSEAKINNKEVVECWGTGNVFREFMHVDDLASAVLFALENWDPNRSTSPRDKNGKPLIFLNVGTGKEITIKNLAEKIALKAKFKGQIIWDKTKPDGTYRKLLSIRRMKELGWSAQISLDDGIHKTLSQFSKDYIH